MKIIDLLNKIANDEVPKKIKYDDRIYTFNEKENNYYENETCSINWDYVALYCLNEPVEILEEEKKIPEKLIILQFSDLIDMSKEILIETIKEQRFKINEIIDYLKSKGE